MGQMGDIAYFLGIIIGQLFLLEVFYVASRTTRTSFVRSYFFSLAVTLLAIFLSSIGNANGGPPNFGDATMRLAAGILIAALDLVRVYRTKS
jgi:hypothetical protein